MSLILSIPNITETLSAKLVEIRRKYDFALFLQFVVDFRLWIALIGRISPGKPLVAR
jgi:hypothetical protein